MSGIAIDDPDCIIDWFATYPDSERARQIIGGCPHDCPHNMTATVGWGPDMAHYELHICTVDTGCAGDCRGWMAAAGATSYQLMRQIRWKLLGTPP